MEQDTLFHYQPSKRVKKIQYLLFVMSTFILSCWATMFVSVVISEMIETNFKLELQSVIFIVVFLGASLIFGNYTLKNTIRKLVITTDEIRWENYLRKVNSIKNNDVANIKWENRTLYFSNQQKIRLSNLPIKQFIIFNSVLLNWLPINALNENAKKFHQFRNQQQQPRMQDLQFVSVGTNQQRQAMISKVGIVSAFILFLLALWIFSFNREAVGGLIFLGVLILSFMFGIWRITVSQVITVQNDGINYLKGKKSQRFVWRKIEAICFHTHSRRILIWEDNKQKTVSCSRMEPQEVDKVASFIFQQAVINNIPVGIFEGII